MSPDSGFHGDLLEMIGGTEDRFRQAAEDLRFLLGKGYPRTGALTFVGNHYQLPKDQREILHRGVYPGAESLTRRNKLLGPDKIRGRAVGVDGYNVIITVESALVGRDLIDCDDGVIRDAAWLSSSYRPSEVTDNALDIILDYLEKRRALSIVFFLYATMSMSGELAAEIRALLGGHGLIGRALAVPLPEAQLQTLPGLVASSNSVIIDRAAEPIDLAGMIIRESMPDIPLIQLGLHQAETSIQSKR